MIGSNNGVSPRTMHVVMRKSLYRPVFIVFLSVSNNSPGSDPAFSTFDPELVEDSLCKKDILARFALDYVAAFQNCLILLSCGPPAEMRLENLCEVLTCRPFNCAFRSKPPSQGAKGARKAFPPLFRTRSIGPPPPACAVKNVVPKSEPVELDSKETDIKTGNLRSASYRFDDAFHFCSRENGRVPHSASPSA